MGGGNGRIDFARPRLTVKADTDVHAGNYDLDDIHIIKQKEMIEWTEYGYKESTLAS